MYDFQYTRVHDEHVIIGHFHAAQKGHFGAPGLLEKKVPIIGEAGSGCNALHHIFVSQVFIIARAVQKKIVTKECEGSHSDKINGTIAKRNLNLVPNTTSDHCILYSHGP